VDEQRDWMDEELVDEERDCVHCGGDRCNRNVCNGFAVRRQVTLEGQMQELEKSATKQKLKIQVRLGTSTHCMCSRVCAALQLIPFPDVLKGSTSTSTHTHTHTHTPEPIACAKGFYEGGLCTWSGLHSRTISHSHNRVHVHACDCPSVHARAHTQKHRN
jgi:hypothetical protein